jgi:hypothetical protein
MAAAPPAVPPRVAAASAATRAAKAVLVRSGTAFLLWSAVLSNVATDFEQL